MNERFSGKDQFGRAYDVRRVELTFSGKTGAADALRKLVEAAKAKGEVFRLAGAEVLNVESVDKSHPDHQTFSTPGNELFRVSVRSVDGLVSKH